MFTGGIVRGAFNRTNRSLTGHTALELSSDFLGAALLQRIGASTRHQRERAEDQ
jgi:hypothetical protein